MTEEKKRSFRRAFGSREAYYAWNEEMIGRYDPVKYYSFSAIRVLEYSRFHHIVRTLRRHGHGVRFLEVGCGHGFMLREIERSGLYPFCLGGDISLPSLTEARKRAGKAHVVQTDGEFLAFANGSFDVVCLTEVIEHVPDQAAVLKEAARVLAPGGLMVVTAPNEHLINRLKSWVYGVGLDRLLFWRYRPSRRMDDEWHLHAMDRQSLGALMEQTGLRVLQWKRLPVRWLPMRHLVACRKAAP